MYRDGRNPTFWYSVGCLYFQINQHRDALDAYMRAARLDPGNPTITQRIQLLRSIQTNGEANDMPVSASAEPGANDDFVSGFQTTTTQPEDSPTAAQPEEDSENNDFSQPSFTDSGNSVLTSLACLGPY